MTDKKKDMNMAVSVIIPVYNTERYLQQCIDSLLNQTLDACEFLFVNDASTDGSLDILRKNEKEQPGRIRVIDSPENLRQGGARNLGLKAARGKYIGYVDSDDFVHPEMYRDLVRKAEETKADAVYIQYTLATENAEYSLNYPWEENPPLIDWDQRLLMRSGEELTDQGTMDLLALPVGGVYCGLYRKDVLLSSGITFPERVRYEDNYWDSMIKCFFRKVAFVEKIRYYYRENPSSTLHTRNQEYQFRDRITVEKKLLDDARKMGFFDRLQEAYEWIFIFRYGLNTYDLYVRMHDRIEYAVLRSLMRDIRKEFPHWFRNPYFRDAHTWKGRIRYALNIACPVLYYKVFFRLLKDKENQ